MSEKQYLKVELYNQDGEHEQTYHGVIKTKLMRQLINGCEERHLFIMVKTMNGKINTYYHDIGYYRKVIIESEMGDEDE